MQFNISLIGLTAILASQALAHIDHDFYTRDLDYEDFLNIRDIPSKLASRNARSFEGLAQLRLYRDNMRQRVFQLIPNLRRDLCSALHGLENIPANSRSRD